ncbi:hypothetical protein [Chloroflexus sp. Y-396-1]|uniref:DUF6962 family protein n=1 Tax=Chloroflexus sp. Y-396-1 TaxID=867845 RepID=UPI00048A6063|nr:hypothetical protein [Chloroflexus sp. Y-396-1]
MLQIETDKREQTTAVTDLMLAGAALGAIWRLRTGRGWRARLWQLAFGLLAMSSLLGAIIHGLRLSAATRERLWQPLNALLALVISFFIMLAIGDRWGENVSRRISPALISTAPAFVWISRRFQRGFLTFIIYETVAMTIALAIYTDLAYRHRFPGAGKIASGILVTILAAAIQNSSMELHIGDLVFDHNGLFHLVQMVGLLFLMEGARASIGLDSNV